MERRRELATVRDFELLLARHPGRSEEWAWNEFDNSYRPRVVVYLTHLKGQRVYDPIVEDMASNILVAFYRDFTEHRSKWPSDRRIWPWFRRACWNEWCSTGKRESRFRVVELIDEAIADSADIVAELEDQERADHLQDCIQRLPAEQRRMLQLRNLGIKTVDIARQLGVSTGTVCNRWRQAIERLGECMSSRHGYEVPQYSKASPMTKECEEVRVLLPQLLEFQGADDPFQATTAPLRKHLAACPECQVAAEQQRAFLEQVAEALALSPDAEELSALEPRMAPGRAKFLEMVRAHVAAANPTMTAKEEAPRPPWPIFFPTFHVPRLAPLRASDAAPTPLGTREQLIQVRDEARAALVEVLLSDAGNRLFVTLMETAQSADAVHVTLTAENGASAEADLELRDGSGEWRLPEDLILEGSCSVRVSSVSSQAGR